MKSFSIIGAGRLGTALGRALVRRGWKPEAIIDKEARAARGARRIIGQGRASTSLDAAARSGEVVVIAVPDDEVSSVAGGLAKIGGSWVGRSVVHTSGLLPARVLEPLAKRGARVASLHPIQSFPHKDVPVSIFKGVAWGVEGDPAGVEAAGEIVRILHGSILILSEENKPLYHAACSLASNALVALEWTATDLLRAMGIDEKAAAGMLVPLAQGTLQNVKNLGLGKALTGPILRGDVDTIRKHLEALRNDPGTREVYSVMGRQILRLASKTGLPGGRVRALKRLLEGG